MMRRFTPVLALGLLLPAGCGGDEPFAEAFMPTDGTGVPVGGTETGPAETTGAETGDEGPDDDTTTGGATSDGETSDGETSDGETSDGETSDGEPVDCTPAWVTPWIGSPCAADGDCAFEGGTCLQDGDGFPCGTCTQDCTTICPDADGTPVTYCINGTDVGLADAGYCLSQCDPVLLPTEGCRDGYVCNVLRRFDDTSVNGVCIPEEFGEMEPPGNGLVEEIDHEFLIDHFGGDPVNALMYGPDLDSFQLYLDAVGVEHTTAAEIVEPNNPAAATECGYTILLPERDQWEKIGALALMTDVLTELVGEPIYMRNWWRPPCYNAAVGGAANGDHPAADAVDLDFSSETSRAIAQKFLCESYWDQDIVEPEEIAPGVVLDPRLNMSVGLGGITIHLGVLSSGGRRFWHYASYTDEPDSGNCW